MYLLFDIKDLLQLINDNIKKQIKLIEYYDIKYEFKIKISYLDADYYNQNEIMKDKYKYIKKLYIRSNKKIININHMTRLEELNASWDCGIDDNGIKNLVNIKKLYIQDNKKITNINHMIKLEELDASFNCGINDNRIKNLVNIKKLNVEFNEKIKDINHMTKLEELNASGYNCGIDDNGIKELINLKKLQACGNKKITNINHMTKLKELVACCDSGIDDKGIKK